MNASCSGFSPGGPRSWHRILDIERRTDLTQGCRMTAVTAAESRPAQQPWLRLHQSLQRRHRLPLHPRRGRTGGIGYELLGRPVVALADRFFATGQHNLRWHGADDQGQTLASGLTCCGWLLAHASSRENPPPAVSVALAGRRLLSKKLKDLIHTQTKPHRSPLYTAGPNDRHFRPSHQRKTSLALQCPLGVVGDDLVAVLGKTLQG